MGRRTFVGNFIHIKWANMQKRAGKYKHLATECKQNNYANIKICFSREEFSKWCWEREDIIKTLQRPSIDRIDNSKDYTFDNIQIIELSENIAKEKRKGTLTEGVCYKCKELKNKDLFYKDKRRWSGFSTICKICDNLRKINKGAGVK